MELGLQVRYGPLHDQPDAKPLQYQVTGLPPTLVVLIGRGPVGSRWQILRIDVMDNGGRVKRKERWTGDYGSPEEALAARQE